MVTPLNWFKIVSSAALLILGGLILFGAYKYYYSKPVPVINNYSIAGNMTQTTTQKVRQKNIFIGGTVDSDRHIGVIGGFLF